MQTGIAVWSCSTGAQKRSSGTWGCDPLYFHPTPASTIAPITTRRLSGHCFLEASDGDAPGHSRIASVWSGGRDGAPAISESDACTQLEGLGDSAVAGGTGISGSQTSSWVCMNSGTYEPGGSEIWMAGFFASS